MTQELLLLWAKKYLWWQVPDEAVSNPKRVVAATMNLGSLEDYHLLFSVVSAPELEDVLGNSAPGSFTARAWSFWHRMLGKVSVMDEPPPMPQREFR